MDNIYLFSPQCTVGQPLNFEEEKYVKEINLISQKKAWNEAFAYSQLSSPTPIGNHTTSVNPPSFDQDTQETPSRFQGPRGPT